jgi:hypothetical protein
MKSQLKRLAPVFVTLLLSSTPTLAVTGGNGSGGGARIEGAFRIRAYELIAKVADSPAADALCPAAILKAALEKSEIAVVDKLVDPVSKTPIVDKALDAWTTPGRIQLLQTAWTDFLRLGSNQAERSVDVLILHEVYRATSGLCSDENFAISGKVLPLFNSSKRFSEVYKIAYRNAGPNAFPGWDNLYCEEPVIEGVPVTCLDSRAGGLRIIRGVASTGSSLLGKVWSFTTSRVRQSRSFLISEQQQLWRLLNYVSPDHPLYVIIDLQTHTMSYGFDMTNLIKIEL